MKSLLILAALVGFTSYSGIAQHKHTNSCGHSKTVQHKKKMSASNLGSSDRVVIWQKLLTCASNKAAKAAPPVARPEACYSYRKNNIVVTECPGLMSDPSKIEFSSQSSYLGYYPQVGTIVTVNPVIAPQHNTINKARGAAPSGGNYCGPDCSSQ
jgi:hypothetical protein